MVDAMTELGRYADDAGDYREAVRWYRNAAQLGDPYAEWVMGRYYEGGKGVRRDLGEALQWYGRAQNSGFDAESNIAAVYAEQGDLFEAHLWYERALEAETPSLRKGLATAISGATSATALKLLVYIAIAVAAAYLLLYPPVAYCGGKEKVAGGGLDQPAVTCSCEWASGTPWYYPGQLSEL